MVLLMGSCLLLLSQHAYHLAFPAACFVTAWVICRRGFIDRAHVVTFSTYVFRLATHHDKLVIRMSLAAWVRLLGGQLHQIWMIRIILPILNLLRWSCVHCCGMLSGRLLALLLLPVLRWILLNLLLVIEEELFKISACKLGCVNSGRSRAIRLLRRATLLWLQFLLLMNCL